MARSKSKRRVKCIPPRRRIVPAQPTHHAPPDRLSGGHLKTVLVLIAILFFGKILSFKINDSPMSGHHIPRHCDGPLEGVTAGDKLPGCGIDVVDGVCVLRPCPKIDEAVGTEDTGPPPDDLTGTPTVDNDDAWRQAQGVQGGTAACTGPCSPRDVGKLELKRQMPGIDVRPPRAVVPTPDVSSKPKAPASTTMPPNGTQTSEIPLQTNVESGEPRGVMQGVGWNSCASSAALLGLVAIGVVVLL